MGARTKQGSHGGGSRSKQGVRRACLTERHETGEWDEDQLQG